jgi:hypothetical protein
MAEFLEQLQDAGWQGYTHDSGQRDGTLYVAPQLTSPEYAAELLDTRKLTMKQAREGDVYLGEDIVVKQFYHPDQLSRLPVRRPEPGGVDDMWATVALESGLASINAQTDYYNLRGVKLLAAFVPKDVENGGAKWAIERVTHASSLGTEYDPKRMMLPHYDDRSDLCAAGLKLAGLSSEVYLDDSVYSGGHNWIIEKYPDPPQNFRGSAVKIDTHMRRPTLWKRSWGLSTLP